MFYEGLQAYKANRRSESGEKFNKSVEVFLYSSLNIQRDPNLRECYSQVIETVYRIEFPSSPHKPEIRRLSETCGWKWTESQFKFADEVTLQSQLFSTPSRQQEKLIGFDERGFEPSPLDELARLEVTAEELEVNGRLSSLRLVEATVVLGDTWQSISNRTGVAVVDLMAANPGMREPKGKVFVPLTVSNRITSTSYSRPTNQSLQGPSRGVRIVRAQAGDTVAKVASRNGADPAEVAKYNGLRPNSVLGAGREIKIPLGSTTTSNNVLTSPSRSFDSTYGISCASLKAPAVQKLRLGITSASAASLIGRKLTLRPNRFTYDTTYYAAFRGPKGVRQMYLGFYKDRLYVVSVEYDNSIEWSGINEFQQAVARAFEFPRHWTQSVSGVRSVGCNAFNVSIEQTLSKSYRLILFDPQAIQQMSQVRSNKIRQLQKEQEQKRKTFKP